MSPLLIIILLLVIFGGLPNWGYHHYGYGPSGVSGLLLLVLVVMLLTGRM